MTEFFSALAVRIFVGGIISCAALTLAGDGAKKEIVRLCCASVMIILVLTPVKGASINFSALTGEAADAERQINAAVSAAQARERDAIAAAVEEYIENQALALGIGGKAEVQYAADGQNALRIASVTIICADVSEAAKDALTKLIAQNCGVDISHVIIIEEDGNEN